MVAGGPWNVRDAEHFVPEDFSEVGKRERKEPGYQEVCILDSWVVFRRWYLFLLTIFCRDWQG